MRGVLVPGLFFVASLVAGCGGPVEVEPTPAAPEAQAAAASAAKPNKEPGSAQSDSTITGITAPTGGGGNCVPAGPGQPCPGNGGPIGEPK